MKKILLLSLFVAVAFSVSAQSKKQAAKKQEKNNVVASEINNLSDSLSYAAGMTAAPGLLQLMDRMKKDFEMVPGGFNTEVFIKGFMAVLNNDTTISTLDRSSSFFRHTMNQLYEQKVAAYRAENEAWIKENAKKEGVVTTASGLQYKVITMGTGDKPAENSKVTVKYEGHLIDGTEFDSSYKRNPQTITFPVGGVIKGWTEALLLMPVGSKWELYIPQELAYGSREMGNGEIPAYSTLVFTVELVSVENK